MTKANNNQNNIRPAATSYTYGNGGCCCACDGCGYSYCCSHMYYTPDGQHLCYSCYQAWLADQENNNDTAEQETPVGNGGTCFECDGCHHSCDCSQKYCTPDGKELCYSCYQAWLAEQENNNDTAEQETPVGNGGTCFECDGCHHCCDCSQKYYTPDGKALCYGCYQKWLREQENGDDIIEPETPVGDGGNCFRCVECGQCCSCGNISPYDKNGNSVCMACYVQLPHCQNCGAPIATVDRYSQDPSYCDICGKATEITIHGVSEMLVHESHIFDVSNAYGNNVSVTWSTTTPKILNVTAYGSVSALKPGAGVVIATLNSNGKRFRYFVEVKFVCEECGERLSANHLSTLPNICKTCFAALPVCDVCGKRITTKDRHPTKPNMCLTCGKRDDYETFVETLCDEDGNEKQFRIIKVKLENIKPEIIVNGIDRTDFYGINGFLFEWNPFGNCDEQENAVYPEESKGRAISWNYEYEGECQNEANAKEKNYIYNRNLGNEMVYRDTLVIYRDTVVNKVKYEICRVYEVEQIEEFFKNNYSDYKILRMIGGGTLSIGDTPQEWQEKFVAEAYSGWEISNIDYRSGIGIKQENDEYKVFLAQSRQKCSFCDLRDMFAKLECEAAIFLNGGDFFQGKWKEHGNTKFESCNILMGEDEVSSKNIWNMIRIIDTSVME